MDSWTAIAFVATGGIGALAFLRVVANEVSFQNHLIELRERKEEEARRRERKLEEKEASEGDISTAQPISTSAEEAA